MISCFIFLFQFCKTSHIEFLTWRVWIGLWVFVITVVVVAVEGSFLVRYITRFTEEVFAILISLIFIFEVIHKLQEVCIIRAVDKGSIW